VGRCFCTTFRVSFRPLAPRSGSLRDAGKSCLEIYEFRTGDWVDLWGEVLFRPGLGSNVCLNKLPPTRVWEVSRI